MYKLSAPWGFAVPLIAALAACHSGGAPRDLALGDDLGAGDLGVGDLAEADRTNADLESDDSGVQAQQRYAYLFGTEQFIQLASFDPSTGSLRRLEMVRDPLRNNISFTIALSPSIPLLVDVESGILTSYALDPVSGLPTTAASSIDTSAEVFAAVFSPSGVLYTTDTTHELLQPYAVSTAGVLTAIGTGTMTDGMESAVIDPMGHFLYGCNYTKKTLSGFSLAADGSTTALAGFPIMEGSGTNLGAPVIHPSGKFLALPLGDSAGIAMYAINTATGALTPVPGSPFAAADPVTGIFTPDGTIFYASQDNDQIAGFTVDATSGALTPIVGLPTPGSFESLTMDPSGHFLYVPLNFTQKIETVSYAISASGALTETARLGYTFDGILFGAPRAPITVSAQGAYVVNTAAAGSISQLAVASTGALTTVPMPPTINGGLQAVADPRGKFLYVASSTDGVHAYAIGSVGVGALAELTGSPYTAPGATALALSPSGQFLYVTTPSTDALWQFFVNTDGTLTIVDNSALAGLSSPSSIAIHPSNIFLWVTNPGADDVSVAFINQASGGLTSMTGVSTGTGSKPSGVTFSPDGEHAFVTLFGTSQVASYQGFSDTGAPSLTQLYAAGTNPAAVAVDGLDRFVYVTDSGPATTVGYHSAIVAFSITPSSAVLAPLSTPSFASGARPFALSASADGRFLLAACAGVPPTVTGALSAYTIGAQGLLTAVPSVPSVGTSLSGVAVTSTWK